jgi:APA family basic amino acid/polyamine antiporter
MGPPNNNGESEGAYKREIGWFSSFSMAYGDVGADVYIGLGVAFLYAAGAAPLAFLIASLVYVTVSLAYAELAPTYPYAGGAPIYTLRASNTLVSFLTGWALMLDYVLCASLFASASAGYLLFIFPELGGLNVQLGPLNLQGIGLFASLIVLFLLIVNYLGIKYSAWLIDAIVVIDLVFSITVIFAIGYITAFDPRLFMEQVTVLGNNKMLEEVSYLPNLDVSTTNFLYGITVAMTSFIGVESIAQAAEETRRPHKWIPRGAKLAAVIVPTYVLLLSVLASGSVNWTVIAANVEDPIAVLVSNYPAFGGGLSLLIAVVAVLVTLASSNTGIIGVSRLTSSMGKFGLLPHFLYKIHPRLGTPTRSIMIFGTIALLLASLGNIPLLVSLYNYGALFSYVLLMISLIILRNRERNVYRPWVLRPSIRIRRNGDFIEVPVVAMMGLLGTAAIFGLYLLLHAVSRIAGTIWMAVGVATYIVYRKLVLKRPTISKEEGYMVVPAGYKMQVTVLVKPFEDEEPVIRTLTSYLDKRFEIKLLSVIEPEPVSLTGEERASVEASLKRIVKALRSKGYSATCEVREGELEEVVSDEIVRNDPDFVVYLVRGLRRGMMEKASVHDSKIRSIMSKYPGRVMVLKKES